MQHSKIHPLPPYTEGAMGYLSETPTVRWVAVYRTSEGEAVWDDGIEQGDVPPGLLPIFERLWGRLVSGYTYVLDLERRRVQVLLSMVLEPFFLTVAPRQANAAWLTNADEAQALIAALIDHAETLTGTGVEQGCVECYYGYAWVEGLQQFVPCAWCNDTTG